LICCCMVINEFWKKNLGNKTTARGTFLSNSKNYIKILKKSKIHKKNLKIKKIIFFINNAFLVSFSRSIENRSNYWVWNETLRFVCFARFIIRLISTAKLPSSGKFSFKLKTIFFFMACFHYGTRSKSREEILPAATFIRFAPSFFRREI
jgi:hypothetical protein